MTNEELCKNILMTEGDDQLEGLATDYLRLLAQCEAMREVVDAAIEWKQARHGGILTQVETKASLLDKALSQLGERT